MLLYALLVGMLAVATAAKIPYIIGGHSVYPVASYPFQLSLQTSLGRHTCGAVLISPEWVLTAAHCTEGRHDQLRVISGAHDILTLEEGQPQVHEIDHIIEHENYWSDGDTANNDTALIRLKKPVELGKYVSTIALAVGDSPDFVGHECSIIGWGTIRVLPSGLLIAPNLLQEGTVDVHTDRACEKIYGTPIDHSQICVGQLNKVGACFGDSGGPAVCDVNGVLTHVGIASYVKYDSCGPSYPTVYARTSAFREWIRLHSGI